MYIKTKIADRSNYGAKRSTSIIKYIVIHYTGNDGDRAINNANYFATKKGLKASAHYFVDDNSIYQSVPDNYVSYSVGVDYSNGKAKYHGKCTNANSINIELCDTVRNGKYDVTKATINMALELTRSLMKKYGIPVSNVIRHWDVCGKECPKYWVNDTKWNSEFKNKIEVVSEGWIKDNVGWWYRYSDGTYPKSCWKTINGADYYFKASGYIATKEYIKSDSYSTNGKLYYVNEEGKWDGKVYKWEKDEKGWWLTQFKGVWYPKEEWCFIDSKWYYFDKKGYMVTGTKTIDGRIYSFRKDGSLVE